MSSRASYPINLLQNKLDAANKRIAELEARLAAAEADAGVPPPCPDCGGMVSENKHLDGWHSVYCVNGCGYGIRATPTREAAYREHYRRAKEGKTA